MKLLHYCPEGWQAKPGINYEWSPSSKPRLRFVVRLFGKYREMYVRFRPKNYDGGGISRKLIIRFRSNNADDGAQ